MTTLLAIGAAVLLLLTLGLVTIYERRPRKPIHVERLPLGWYDWAEDPELRPTREHPNAIYGVLRSPAGHERTVWLTRPIKGPFEVKLAARRTRANRRYVTHPQVLIGTRRPVVMPS